MIQLWTFSYIITDQAVVCLFCDSVARFRVHPQDFTQRTGLPRPHSIV